MGCKKGIHGVGILVADRWIEKMLDVKRVSKRVIIYIRLLNILLTERSSITMHKYTRIYTRKPVN